MPEHRSFRTPRTAGNYTRAVGGNMGPKVSATEALATEEALVTEALATEARARKALA